MSRRVRVRRATQISADRVRRRLGWTATETESGKAANTRPREMGEGKQGAARCWARCCCRARDGAVPGAAISACPAGDEQRVPHAAQRRRARPSSPALRAPRGVRFACTQPDAEQQRSSRRRVRRDDGRGQAASGTARRRDAMRPLVVRTRRRCAALARTGRQVVVFARRGRGGTPSWSQQAGAAAAARPGGGGKRVMRRASAALKEARGGAGCGGTGQDGRREGQRRMGAGQEGKGRDRARRSQRESTASAAQRPTDRTGQRRC
jgi:hypothetical protein